MSTLTPDPVRQGERNAEPTHMWFDGEIAYIGDVGVHPFTHALHYGSGVFEGIRSYETPRGTGVFRLRDHIDRLFASAAIYDIAIPYTREELSRAIFATLAINGFTAGYIRPLIYFGAAGIGLAPKYTCPVHALIALKPLTGSLIGDTAEARITVSPWQKASSRALPSTAKACGHYTNSILALHDAKARGFDEAILLNDRGDVAEGTGENIFFVKSGRLHTNDTSADTLAGITQATVHTLAREAGIDVTVDRITLDDLYNADEIFFTGTAAEVMPIGAIDDRTFAGPRPVTEALARSYRTAVFGADPRHPDWVEYA